MSPGFAATLEYDEALLRDAVLAFWRRTVGIVFIVAMSLVAVSLALLLASGDRSWQVGLLAAALLVGAAFAVALYAVHLRRSLSKFRQMGSPSASFTAEHSQFTLSSGLGRTTLPWSAVADVWCYPKFWLVFFSRSQFVTLPLASLSTDMRAFVAERIRASGGKMDPPGGARQRGRSSDGEPV